MKPTAVSKMSDLYLTALRNHFAKGPQVGLQEAHSLGLKAASLHLETLDLGKIHNTALATLLKNRWTPEKREIMTNRAEIFFTEAIKPIEDTHRAAVKAGAALARITATLAQRTQELEASNERWQADIAQREVADEKLQRREQESALLLAESRSIEQRLQGIVREVLAANEDERKRLSHHLHDEIAQTLLGIHVRLLALKKEASASQARLNKEIATTQKLLSDSVEMIKRCAKELGIEDPA